MDKDDVRLQDLLSKNFSDRKEEIFQLDNFINRYKNDSQYDHPDYGKIFSLLIETRIGLINEK
jgi:hypothetical protein